MKANPGGRIAPDEVVGRDRLIARLWDTLERLSVVLTAERRIGKTQLIKKMEAEAPEGVLPLYRDLEPVWTPLKFVELVFRDVEAYLSRKARRASRARQVLDSLGGGEVGGIIKFPQSVAPHWKTLLERTVEDLIEHQDRTVIFFWDELPMMLYNVKRREGAEAAMELLDVLRQLRQTHDSLRMVFTGSIGLPNVIMSLQEEGYSNDPTNDMKTINVPPLSSSDAEMLALQLIEGEGIQASNPEETASAIAAAVDNVPFYIHHLVDDLKLREGGVDEKAVQEIVKGRLIDSHDEWRMEHYRKRVNTYYTSDRQTLALTMLDIVAIDGPLPFETLFNLVKSRIEIADEEVEQVRRMLTLLQRDHYIELDTDGTYRFRFPLIRRWWHLHRG